MASLPDISAHLHTSQGFCYPDWTAISDVIEQQVPESEWNPAWETAARTWVDRIRSQLGGNYNIYETANFLILSEAPMRVIKDACRSYEDSLKRILASLAGVGSDEGRGKQVVFMFATIDDYYGYITHFYPDGESPMSSGVFLSGNGYAHFAFPTVDYSSYRTVMVHELTHSCLSHLPLPVWLNEALAMRMEQVICGSDIFHLDQELFEKHAAHWNKETIQQFWTGASWKIPGNSSSLSYNMAQVLWRKIEADLAASRSQVLFFISVADWIDSGDTACTEIFGVSLADLVTDFLGDGPWAPVLPLWPADPPRSDPPNDTDPIPPSRQLPPSP